MPDLQIQFRRTQKYLLFFLSFFVLGWGFTPYQSVFLGLMLGTTVSFYNVWLLKRKTIKFGEAVATGGRAVSLGMLSRMAAAGAAVLAALEFPDKFHLISVIMGLMTSYLVIMIDTFIQLLNKQPEER